ncbi:MAG: hypothetical protein V1847_01030 [Candidatus Diapherotrites archaeon]
MGPLLCTFYQARTSCKRGDQISQFGGAKLVEKASKEKIAGRAGRTKKGEQKIGLQRRAEREARESEEKKRGAVAEQKHLHFLDDVQKYGQYKWVTVDYKKEKVHFDRSHVLTAFTTLDPIRKSFGLSPENEMHFRALQEVIREKKWEE